MQSKEVVAVALLVVATGRAVTHVSAGDAAILVNEAEHHPERTIDTQPSRAAIVDGVTSSMIGDRLVTRTGRALYWAER